jgi:hypothetical protein
MCVSYSRNLDKQILRVGTDKRGDLQVNLGDALVCLVVAFSLKGRAANLRIVFFLLSHENFGVYD